MAWTSLSSRFTNLPLVLAGPIVRKTTSNTVSVWIALKESRTNLTLTIKQKSSSGFTDIKSQSASTIKFGQNLHVAVITVSGLDLNPDVIYYYDINFGSNQTFSSPDILSKTGNGISKIVFGSDLLPSFTLPPSNIQNLSILHGSCRKIHGGQMSGGDAQTPGYFYDVDYLDLDALSFGHDILATYYAQPANRPHQLFLTGDQIYADDVSDLMLYMLNDAAGALIGINEILPLISPTADIGPLKRYKIINTTAKMTSGKYAKSHLMKLAEFYCMYLFVWADTLWSDLPEENDFKNYINNIDSESSGGFELDDDEKTIYYTNQRSALLNFKSHLTKVRRLLANIPTYMMFDDHEITDDWFISKEWCDNVLNNVLGKRIIQNGLSGFAVFQAWGNTPEKFSDSALNENKILTELTKLTTTSGNNSTTWNAISNLIIPHRDTTGGTNEEMMKLIGGPDWYFYLDFGYYQVIVLNCRTNRGFNSKGFCRLLSSGTIDNQINQASVSTEYKFTIIVAPAPVIGHALLEGVQKFFKGKGTLKGVAEYDYEPWSSDEVILSSFLNKIKKFRRVIFLSGDVHYAFSAKVEYQYDMNTGSPKLASFVQLTSSSLKNSEKKTAHRSLKRSPVLGVPALSGGKGFDLSIDLDPFTNIGWYTNGKKVKMIISSSHRDGPPSRIDIDILSNKDYNFENKLFETYQILQNPDRQYKVSFLEDTRDDDKRGKYSFGGPGYNRFCSAAKIHKSAAEFDAMSVAVGMNNIGLVKFSENSGKLIVEHYLWFKPEEIPDTGAWTLHTTTID